MPPKRENHKSNVDFAAALRQHGALHATAAQDFGEQATSNSSPPNRWKKNTNEVTSSHGRTAANRTVLSESPWTCYNELYSLQFGTSVHFSIAERKQFQPEENPLCIVKRFSAVDAQECIQSVQRIRHPQFVQALDFFLVQEEYFVAFEYMPLSLAEVAGNPLMNDLRLSSMLGQVVDGLLYLEKNSLGHGQLTCSNILIDTSGSVKLWGQEFIQKRLSFKETIKSLAVITMKLVQGYAKEDGTIGLDRPGRFPLGFDFLSALEQMSSMRDLTKVRFSIQHTRSQTGG
ncbi:Serine/threonine-protein kinase PAK 2 [Beauveria bassiana]|nr:Serine/threonine-protein kinase PAK 2 [Beauveria bassiana]